MTVVSLWAEMKSQVKEDRVWGREIGTKCCVEKQEIDSRDKVKHIEKNDQLFVEIMKVDETCFSGSEG